MSAAPRSEVSILAIDGPVDDTAISALLALITDADRTGRRAVLVDLSAAADVDAHSAARLVAALVRKRVDRVALVAAPHPVEPLVQCAQIPGILLCGTLDLALRMLADPADDGGVPHVSLSLPQVRSVAVNRP